MAGESQCGLCGSFYQCLIPEAGAKSGCKQKIEEQESKTGVFVLRMEVANPHRSVLQTLESEIMFWAQNHNIEIRKLDLEQTD